MFRWISVGLLCVALSLPGCSTSPMHSMPDAGEPAQTDSGESCNDDDKSEKKKHCDKLPNGSGSDVPTVDSPR